MLVKALVCWTTSKSWCWLGGYVVGGVCRRATAVDPLVALLVMLVARTTSSVSGFGMLVVFGIVCGTVARVAADALEFEMKADVGFHALAATVGCLAAVARRAVFERFVLVV